MAKVQEEVEDNEEIAEREKSRFDGTHLAVEEVRHENVLNEHVSLL